MVEFITGTLLKLFRELGKEMDLVLKDFKNRSLSKVLEYN